MVAPIRSAVSYTFLLLPLVMVIYGAIFAGEVVLDAVLRPILILHVGLMAIVGLTLARRWWSADDQGFRL